MSKLHKQWLEEERERLNQTFREENPQLEHEFEGRNWQPVYPCDDGEEWGWTFCVNPEEELYE